MPTPQNVWKKLKDLPPQMDSFGIYKKKTENRMELNTSACLDLSLRGFCFPEGSKTKHVCIVFVTDIRTRAYAEYTLHRCSV